jgi:hypothetical protein
LFDVSEILSLKPIDETIGGYQVRIMRPTLANLIDALEMREKSPAESRAWLLVTHLRTRDDEPVFANIREAMLCPAGFAAAACVRIEGLYSEGSD